MKQVLDVEFIGCNSFSLYASDELIKHEQNLLKKTDLRDKLQYYNDHICSLVYNFPSDGLQTRGQYDHWHGVGNVFFRRDFVSEEEFEIYLEVRQKEIDRLLELTKNKEKYPARFKIFMDQKAGEKRFEIDDIRVRTNEYLKWGGNGVLPPGMRENEFVEGLNFEPQTEDEFAGFNFYLTQYVRQNIKSRSHWLVEIDYRVFDVNSAYENFMERIKKTRDPKGVINKKITDIEKFFRYGEIVNYESYLYANNIGKSSNHLETWQAVLFNAFVDGLEPKEYKFRYRKFDINEIKAFIHVEEIFKFYNKLKDEAGKKRKAAGEATNRENILVYQFKVEAGLEPPMTAKEWQNKFGGRYKLDFYTLHPNSKDYKEPTEKEQESVLSLLEDFPTAKKLAKKAFDLL